MKLTLYLKPMLIVACLIASTMGNAFADEQNPDIQKGHIAAHKKDLITALKYYRKAEKAGDIDGQAFVGMFYIMGEGGIKKTKKNKQIGAEKVTDACERGSEAGCRYMRLSLERDCKKGRQKACNLLQTF